MRRLAIHSRNDAVLSVRDYQSISSRNGIAIRFDPSRSCRAIFSADLSDAGEGSFVGCGAYLKANKEVDINIKLSIELNSYTKEMGVNLLYIKIPNVHYAIQPLKTTPE